MGQRRAGSVRVPAAFYIHGARLLTDLQVGLGVDDGHGSAREHVRRPHQNGVPHGPGKDARRLKVAQLLPCRLVHASLVELVARTACTHSAVSVMAWAGKMRERRATMVQ